MHQKFCSTAETFSKILKSQQKILSSSSHQKSMLICYLADSEATYNFDYNELIQNQISGVSTLEGTFDLYKSLEILTAETTAIATYLCGSYYVF